MEEIFSRPVTSGLSGNAENKEEEEELLDIGSNLSHIGCLCLYLAVDLIFFSLFFGTTDDIEIDDEPVLIASSSSRQGNLVKHGAWNKQFGLYSGLVIVHSVIISCPLQQRENKVKNKKRDYFKALLLI